ncbi:MAG: SMC-Scp complex subunit ScpB [Proteobacteria bacterium]|nr:SMC-Scp complex subunit ScpB [Pseudomonadota bacterium]
MVSEIDFPVRLVEALLFASPKPLTETELAEHLPDGTDVKAILAQLAEAYAGRGIQLAEVAGGWAIRTASDLASVLRLTVEVPRRLSRAAIEALAIIAYHQPVTRAEIEDIRGVALSRGSLDQLLEAGWIKPRGHKQTPGRPALWVTTDEFLIHFGLANVGDLPGVDELKAAGLLDRRPAFTTLAMREDEKVEGDDAEDDAKEEAEIRAERAAAAAAAADDADDAADTVDHAAADDDEDDDDAAKPGHGSRAAGIAAAGVDEPF